MHQSTYSFLPYTHVHGLYDGGTRGVDPLFFHVVPPQRDIGDEKVVSVSLSGFGLFCSPCVQS